MVAFIDKILNFMRKHPWWSMIIVIIFVLILYPFYAIGFIAVILIIITVIAGILGTIFSNISKKVSKSSGREKKTIIIKPEETGKSDVTI